MLMNFICCIVSQSWWSFILSSTKNICGLMCSRFLTFLSCIYVSVRHETRTIQVNFGACSQLYRPVLKVGQCFLKVSFSRHVRHILHLVCAHTRVKLYTPHIQGGLKLAAGCTCLHSGISAIVFRKQWQTTEVK